MICLIMLTDKLINLKLLINIKYRSKINFNIISNDCDDGCQFESFCWILSINKILLILKIQWNNQTIWLTLMNRSNFIVGKPTITNHLFSNQVLNPMSISSSNMLTQIVMDTLSKNRTINFRGWRLGSINWRVNKFKN